MDAATLPVRSLVLWFADWPVTALALDGPDPLNPQRPIAVVENNAVIACSAAARAEGVRRGQRRRDAQARCPRLVIVPSDATRDYRAFSPVVAGLEERAPGVQIIRPGLCALRVRGPARYYGGEREAAMTLMAALRDRGVAQKGMGGVRAGIADGPFTAEQAARLAGEHDPVCIVAEGESAAFLAPLPVAVLGVASDLSVSAATSNGRGRARTPARTEAKSDLVSLLARLGVHTLGQFAAMSDERVRERFGDRGVRLHALAGGRDSRTIEPRVPPPELQREVAFEPPLDIAEQVAFGIRVAVDEFIAGIGAVDLVCTELRVELVGDRGERSERVWLHPTSFDAAAVVDRVRWQLGEDDGRMRSGVALVRISPEAVDAAHHHRPAIFGSGPEERVHHALSRVQAMLGHQGVLTPEVGGGRWLAERQVLVPWGDRAVVAKERARPWPGSLPDPLPTTVFSAQEAVDVASLGGFAVDVDDRGMLSAVPARFTHGGRTRAIVEWAGPWPVIERGWDAARARRAHRFQIVDADGVAWLLVCDHGAWLAEARYD
ncbi:DNA polymerase Y family protein [Microbacterium sp. C7(2022)]|uniref:DNA polymerase Y family protein n=1 Tax=Microbacterium sp. C7(2022) TaxID=2992759 RepID=UPI00237B2646|nr:DNA polymerase Y family protein [Microbacterium sp. C7(2022)]MDE0547100.1 DNA polymerase Y family protein [Microbacterium sp. C7(2022)]